MSNHSSSSDSNIAPYAQEAQIAIQEILECCCLFQENDAYPAQNNYNRESCSQCCFQNPDQNECHCGRIFCYNCGQCHDAEDMITEIYDFHGHGNNVKASYGKFCSQACAQESWDFHQQEEELQFSDEEEANEEHMSTGGSDYLLEGLGDVSSNTESFED